VNTQLHRKKYYFSAELLIVEDRDGLTVTLFFSKIFNNYRYLICRQTLTTCHKTWKTSIHRHYLVPTISLVEFLLNTM